MSYPAFAPLCPGRCRLTQSLDTDHADIVRQTLRTSSKCLSSSRASVKRSRHCPAARGTPVVLARVGEEDHGGRSGRDCGRHRSPRSHGSGCSRRRAGIWRQDEARSRAREERPRHGHAPSGPRSRYWLSKSIRTVRRSVPIALTAAPFRRRPMRRCRSLGSSSGIRCAVPQCHRPATLTRTLGSASMFRT